jgi:GNAT superfamily N-acetyltransferase
MPIISATPAIDVQPATTAEQIHAFRTFAPAIAPENLRQGEPNRHLFAVADGQIVARCSLWWSSVPVLPGHRVGCIGHYAATDRAAAIDLLDAACAQLQDAGCTIALGPLDGSTFRAYRLVTERAVQGEQPRPPFLLEPANPDAWPEHFRQAGFDVWSEYLSDLAPLTGPDTQLESRTKALAEQGIQLRSLDPEIFTGATEGTRAFDRELARIYPLVMTAFANNPLFTPISQQEFREQYAPVRTLLAPDLVTLAERDGELVGMLFALPDYAQARRGEKVDTVILKTLAVLPQLAGVGLGSLLTARVHTTAYQLGYRWAIHALMHEKNRSRRISAHTARPFRRYTLFARHLVPTQGLPTQQP